MTVTGQIQKYEMRETSVTEFGLDAAAAVKRAQGGADVIP